jgi:glycolate oxidase iron-sulfur subunit
VSFHPALGELLTHCIRCGFCLEACPTFEVTADERESPRGRIYLVRSALEGQLAWMHVEPHLNACLGCRACETACPSGVQYGLIAELARQGLEARKPNLIRKALLTGLTNPRVARVQFALARLLPGRRLPPPLSALLSGQPAEAQSPIPQSMDPWPPFEVPKTPLRGEVVLLEGCVMRVLFPAVHEATRRLLRRAGYRVREVHAGCCGALHAHCGLLEDARRLARKLDADLPADLPLIVNSAGCGSSIKEYAHLDPELEPLARRTLDITVFLFREGLCDQLAEAPGLDDVVTYHDACHLAHGQGVRDEPRALIAAIPGARVVPLPASDTCCGSAGIYNVVQPKMARELLERKWANIASTGATVVASGNPGCHAWIEQASREKASKVRVLHTAELLEAAFCGHRL